MSGTWGWKSGCKNCLEERIWFNKHADGTQYQGMIPAASGVPGSNGRPDGLLWAAWDDDKRNLQTRRLLGIVELKAVPSEITAAVNQLRTYSSGLLENAEKHNIPLTQVIGVAMAGNHMSALEIKVLKFYTGDKFVDEDGVF